MIDVSKVNVGDELQLIPCKVVEVDRDNKAPFSVELPDGRLVWVCVDEIARHIPAPRPFEKGDKVTWGDGATWWEFVAEYEGGAIIINPVTGALRNEPIDSIRHVNAAWEDEIVVTEDDAYRAWTEFVAATGDRFDSMRTVLTDFLKRRKEAGR
jgi:hypothetical protein